MQTLIWNTLNSAQKQAALSRPAQAVGEQITQAVNAIKSNVINNGDKALFELAEKFDKTTLESLVISKAQVEQASQRIATELKQAIQTAKGNIERFHQAQKNQTVDLETQAGVRCQVVTRPIQNVGLYIPGGSAPLFSTVLMLAVPAKIAGCKTIVLCSPPPIADEILYTANLCGVETIYAIGGAQAIFAMANGTESVQKVDKIFGPGNAFVTEAKRQVLQQGTAIDMPAGPSEVLVIADEFADPDFVASDLLSQAEHGSDSQVILVTNCETLAKQTALSIEQQLARLPRAETARKALAHSRTFIAEDLQQCVEISNAYAPEHLVVQVENARNLLPFLDNAGSIFLGAYSPESMGDYASGTNHVLPTYGYTRTHSSLGLADFSKRMTVQELTPQGFKDLANTVMLMAEAEQLEAHKQAVAIRLEKLTQE
ncbi:histidinol dehydrogenase [Pasteurella multocida]|uniref:Histidinol dehydrogenase n=1 Tax=Pasteurella multocida (strain Pm70) TaxID=272843 RepID=HISX_PASMU|nr:histidinol dehydrogenase [Pasteurella multocida]Q9CLM4.1 RecName: Full=Histidinol dehydrogenase; Short=HDH [Pasteurella multocida subsp. multocida str. Pm70]AAK03282.1 HisD [Pasteurella multocida subsp. multocida str. Pm70]APW56663.1 histidinol dehydrogenase [Pasteurella multocida subsp. multocida str. HN07]ARA71059.1 histidinol dehydrogenase [Pasteurella multocida subsp. multocida]ARA88530.1 histidinol dehydrogenase [Pasteurella multocida subsp. septica]AUL53767.1 histidinol dehydrogenase